MSGYATVVAACASCGRLFSFNPHRVPSIRLNRKGEPDPSAERKPVCRECIERANVRRFARGLPAIEVLPGAYDPLPAEEL
jgi:hypothetical protein